MSRTTDYLITLEEDLDKASTLKEVLSLDIRYRGDDGTDTVVQDLFRQAKYESVMSGLNSIGLERSAFKFYNYSMQGKCQIYLDEDIADVLKERLSELAVLYDLPLDESCINIRRDEVILSLSI